MTEEIMINMITNCAKMEAALGLLRSLMVADVEDGSSYPSLTLTEVNHVLVVAGMEVVTKKEKAPNAGEQ